VALGEKAKANKRVVHLKEVLPTLNMEKKAIIVKRVLLAWFVKREVRGMG
jgi:hypothetical protein